MRRIATTLLVASLTLSAGQVFAQEKTPADLQTEAKAALGRNEIPQARKVVDTYLNAFKPQPDVLYSALTVARAAKDRMSEEKYTRALRLEFPDSAQARTLQKP